MKLKPLLEKFPLRDGNWERNAQLKKDGEVKVELDVEEVEKLIDDSSLGAYTFTEKLKEHKNNRKWRSQYEKLRNELAQDLKDHLGEILVRKG